MHDDQAQVLESVTVKTALSGAAEKPPKAWRTRIAVEQAGDTAKVTSVSFVA